VVAKKWFNDEQIWLVLFHQLTRSSFIHCEPRQSVSQLSANNRSDSLSGDRAVVSNNYRKLSRGERVWRRPHNFLRVAKNCSDDKQNSLAASDGGVRDGPAVQPRSPGLTNVTPPRNAALSRQSNRVIFFYHIRHRLAACSLR
jgi:hypothetical protein